MPRALVFAMLAATSVAAGAAAATAVGSSGEVAVTRTVRIEDVDFSPRTVRLRAGDSVRWAFQDGTTPHNVRSRGGPRFRGSSTRQSGTHRVRFRRRGTYRYVCTIHLTMKARVVVR